MTRREFIVGSTGFLLAPRLRRREFSGPPEQSPWLAKIAEQLRQEFNVPAVWLAGGMDGKIEQAVCGVRKLGDPTPASLDDRILVCSISKAMTGLWAASLVNDGKLAYETRLLDLIPELSDGCLEEHRTITLGQLVSHTAGLTNDVAGKDKLDILHPELYPHARLEFAKIALRQPTPTDAVRQEKYSNIGGDLVGCMAERAANLSYEEGIVRFYRESLGLASFGLGEPNPNDDLSAPWSHNIVHGVVTTEKPSTRQWLGAFPAGGNHCTIGDLVLFGSFVVNGFQGRGKILSKDLWARVLSVPTALHADHTTLSALESVTWDAPTLGHQGGFFGASSEVWTIPDLGLAFAVFTNANWMSKTEHESNSAFLARAHQLVFDELRHRRGQRSGPECRVSLRRVMTVDSNGRETTPRRGDKKVRVAIEVDVQGAQSGDIKITAKLGQQAREANFFKGLGSGIARCATFEWDLPETNSTPFLAIVDACHSCGDSDPDGKRFEFPLVIAD